MDEAQDIGYPLVPAFHLSLNEMNSAFMTHLSNVPASAELVRFWELESWTKQLAKMASEWKRAVIDRWIEAMNEQGINDFVVGDKRYYIGTDKKHTVRDKTRLLQALLDQTGGDLDAIINCLSATAFKHGAVKTTFDDDAVFETHYDITTVEDIRTGSPRKVVKNLPVDGV